jgi:hypothetical protein
MIRMAIWPFGYMVIIFIIKMVIPSHPGCCGTPGIPALEWKPGKPGFEGEPGRPGYGGWSSMDFEDYIKEC